MTTPATALPADAITERLQALPAWSADATSIRRVVDAATFLGGIRLVQRVADAAEAMDHHPDIDIRWRQLTFVLSTHTAGGVTDLDFALAATIDDLIDQGPDEP